jgi:hypothetical protein
MREKAILERVPQLELNKAGRVPLRSDAPEVRAGDAGILPNMRCFGVS